MLAEAIDKWFEDIQHYEQTLEEMATASLDENFKEELKAAGAMDAREECGWSNF